MTPTPKSASGATGRHAVGQAQPQGAAGPFVLNLCSSTTPMALSNPEQPELKRFSFFVSRRFEEGRERFRLHMGYFSTLAEAQEWLGAVRDIYPGAWAGEAPGKKLRERAVAAAAAQAQHAAGPPPNLNVPTIHAPVVNASAAVGAAHTPPGAADTTHQFAAAPAPSPKREATATVSATFSAPTAAAPAPAATPKNVPVAKPMVVGSGEGAALPHHVLNSVPVAKAAAPTPLRAPTAAPAPAPKLTPVAAMLAAPRTPASPQGRSLSAAPSVGSAPVARPAAPAQRSVAMPATARTSPAVAATKLAQPMKPAASATQQHAQPNHAAGARPQGTASGARPSSKSGGKANLPNSNVREVLKALEEAPSEAEITGETRMMPAPVLAGLNAAADDNNFTDTQVLKFLETRRADGTELTGVDVETGAISLLKPDDTGTRRALKEAIAENAPVWFAVQLQWSVQPVELSKVPPLAIFSAYTLYTVEGSRDGRKWYGLRLGFFSDAISAKQVAYYVRSEFTSVAVVPVSPQEKTRASDSDKKAEIAFPKRPKSGPVDEFKLLDSDETGSRKAAAAGRAAAPAKSSAAPAQAPGAAGARRAASTKANSRVRARESRSPQTLEETLEILGAGELEMDNGNGETLNESGVRHLRVEVQKNTPFGRLLERLSERVRKP